MPGSAESVLVQVGALTEDNLLIDMTEVEQWGHCYSNLRPVFLRQSDGDRNG